MGEFRLNYYNGSMKIVILFLLQLECQRNGRGSILIYEIDLLKFELNRFIVLVNT